MKSEIVIGERYMTRVSGTLVEAIATGWLEKDGKFRRRDLVRVKRAGAHHELHRGIRVRGRV